jgi:site-specific DNA-methyltransferase (adenine-specific)
MRNNIGGGIQERSLRVITVTCEDCMNLMKRYPDGYFDLAVVDPPYGGPCMYTYLPADERGFTAGATFEIYAIKASASKGIYGTDRVTHGKSMKNAEWDFPPPAEYFRELFRVSKKAVVWGGNNFPLPPQRNFIVWKKTNIPEDFSMAMAEYAWTNIEGNAKVITANSQTKSRIHPTQKPAAVYGHIYQWYTKAGDKVLDTHLGSGSSGVAAIDHLLDFTGCEIDRTYYDAALKRIRRHLTQKNLFDTETILTGDKTGTNGGVNDERLQRV